MRPGYPFEACTIESWQPPMGRFVSGLTSWLGLALARRRKGMAGTQRDVAALV
jgi:hypothetical protein